MAVITSTIRRQEEMMAPDSATCCNESESVCHCDEYDRWLCYSCKKCDRHCRCERPNLWTTNRRWHKLLVRRAKEI